MFVNYATEIKSAKAWIPYDSDKHNTNEEQTKQLIVVSCLEEKTNVEV